LSLSFQKGTVFHLQSRLGLFEGHPRLQASENVQPHDVALDQTIPAWRQLALHGDGHEDIHVLTLQQAVESARRNADDRKRMAVEHDLLADDLRIRAKAARPVTVAQHRHGARARKSIVAGVEQPAECGTDSQNRKVIAPDEFSLLELRRS